MVWRPPGSTRTDTLLPYATLFRSRPGENVFVVQGRLDDPAHVRAHMKTQLAVDTPAADSFRELQAFDRAAQQARVQQQAQAASVEHAGSEQQRRSEERRGGKECVSTCRLRVAPEP